MFQQKHQELDNPGAGGDSMVDNIMILFCLIV